MKMPITIAQISDVHLAPIQGLHPSLWNAKRLLGFANWTLKRRAHHLQSVSHQIVADLKAQSPDHIAVTGDLTNLGLPTEIENARTFLTALGPPNCVTAIPGNHDIYTTNYCGAAEKNRACLTEWKPYMSEDASDRIEASEGHVRTAAEFPFVRTVGPVSIIGLCSAYPTPLFVAAGELGRAQRTALARILRSQKEQGQIRVILIHHPPLEGQTSPRRALKDADQLSNILEEEGAELVLHGHNHTDTLVWLKNDAHPIPIIGVPSASAARQYKKEPPARYNVFKIDRAGGAPHISRIVRGIDDTNGKIVELFRQDLVMPINQSSN